MGHVHSDLSLPWKGFGKEDFVMLFLLVIYSVKGQCLRRCGVRQYLVCIYGLICFGGFRFLLFSFSFSLSLSIPPLQYVVSENGNWVFLGSKLRGVSHKWGDCPTLNIYDVNVTQVCLPLF